MVEHYQGYVFEDAANIFKAADVNGDGVLTKHELQNYMKKHKSMRSAMVDTTISGGKSHFEWDELWKALDEDGNSEIDLHEWTSFYVGLFKQSTPLARSIYKAADKNGDNKLSKGELKEFIQSDERLKAELGVKVSGWAQLFKELDNNNDEVVTEMEWVEFYTATLAKKGK